MRKLTFLTAFLVCSVLYGQAPTDAWITSQLSTIAWNQTYQGVLADYHPITIMLASDKVHLAGYLIHKGDNRVHRLMGEWSKKDQVQLQERDEFDRLTGYLKGTISGDQVHLEWMSADKSRQFNVVAYPSNLVKIKNFKPVAEWIEVDAEEDITISVQKMDYGMVSGLVNRKGIFSRFEGYCLDGSCSIWNTVFQNPNGAPIKVQMRQRDVVTYRVVLDGKEYPAVVKSAVPLSIRQYDNSMGFLDFVYPVFESKTYTQWLARWIDKMWADGVTHLTSINQPGSPGRLVHRSSGWIEVLASDEDYVSGMITYINPGSTTRESFTWLKKEDLFLSASELLNSPEDLEKAAMLTMKNCPKTNDEEYMNWLRETGYSYLLPSKGGLVMLTKFNMIYGDDIHVLPVTESKAFVKRKYWKYFGW